MGKVSFPLINVRKDVTTRWHMKHYTGPTAETIQIPESADEYGYFTAFLTEVPDSGTTTKSVTTTPPKISGFVELRGSPIDEKTLRLLLNPTQFYVNYQTGQLLFHPNQAGRTVEVDYWGKGSLVEADDVNFLHQQILRLEKEHDLPQVEEFGLVDLPTTLEVGQSFPSATLPFAVKFMWKLQNPSAIQSESLKISRVVGSTEKTIAEGIPTQQTTISVDFSEDSVFINPQSILFRLSAVALNGSSVQKDLEIRWVDRIRWGTSPNKLVSVEQIERLVNNQLLVNTKPNQRLRFAEDSGSYKVVVVPRRRPIRRLTDLETNLEVVLEDPVELTLQNQFGLGIPSLVYTTVYPISAPIDGKVLFGKSSEEIPDDSTPPEEEVPNDQPN